MPKSNELKVNDESGESRKEESSTAKNLAGVKEYIQQEFSQLSDKAKEVFEQVLRSAEETRHEIINTARDLWDDKKRAIALGLAGAALVFTLTQCDFVNTYRTNPETFVPTAVPTATSEYVQNEGIREVSRDGLPERFTVSNVVTALQNNQLEMRIIDNLMEWQFGLMPGFTEGYTVRWSVDKAKVVIEPTGIITPDVLPDWINNDTRNHYDFPLHAVTLIDPWTGQVVFEGWGWGNLYPPTKERGLNNKELFELVDEAIGPYTPPFGSTERPSQSVIVRYYLGSLK